MERKIKGENKRWRRRNMKKSRTKTSKENKQIEQEMVKVSGVGGGWRSVVGVAWQQLRWFAGERKV